MQIDIKQELYNERFCIAAHDMGDEEAHLMAKNEIREIYQAEGKTELEIFEHLRILKQRCISHMKENSK